MIVPTNRLLLWFAVVALPFSLLATAVPDTVPLSLGVIALLLVLAGVDAGRASGRLDGVSVRFPEVVRMAKGREGDLTVRIVNERMTIQSLRLGLAFPREVHSLQPDILTFLPGNQTTSTFLWPCKALKQGNYVLDR